MKKLVQQVSTHLKQHKIVASISLLLLGGVITTSVFLVQRNTDPLSAILDTKANLFSADFISAQGIQKYDGPQMYSKPETKVCLEKVGLQGPEIITVYAKKTFAKNNKQSVKEIQAELKPIFGHAVVNNQINWKYDKSKYQYTFIGADAEDAQKWMCYLKHETTFFKNFLSTVELKKVKDCNYSCQSATKAKKCIGPEINNDKCNDIWADVVVDDFVSYMNSFDLPNYGKLYQELSVDLLQGFIQNFKDFSYIQAHADDSLEELTYNMLKSALSLSNINIYENEMKIYKQYIKNNFEGLSSVGDLRVIIEKANSFIKVLDTTNFSSTVEEGLFFILLQEFIKPKTTVKQDNLKEYIDYIQYVKQIDSINNEQELQEVILYANKFVELKDRLNTKAFSSINGKDIYYSLYKFNGESIEKIVEEIIAELKNNYKFEKHQDEEPIKYLINEKPLITTMSIKDFMNIVEGITGEVDKSPSSIIMDIIREKDFVVIRPTTRGDIIRVATGIYSMDKGEYVDFEILYDDNYIANSKIRNIETQKELWVHNSTYTDIRNEIYPVNSIENAENFKKKTKGGNLVTKEGLEGLYKDVINLSEKDKSSIVKIEDKTDNQYTKSHFDCTKVTDISKTECEVLNELYLKTNGVNWKYTGRGIAPKGALEWKNNSITELCKLEDIGCYGNTISSLSLSFHNLTGQIPDSIGKLKNLKGLYLQSNKLIGQIPDSITQIINLKNLFLYGNALTGNLPDLSKLINLEAVNLLDNKLTGNMPDISNLNNLEYLNLKNNIITGNLPDISNLINLKVINLYNNKLTGSIPEIGKLTKLIDLNLAKNELTGEIPDGFNNLSLLKNLELQSNKLTGSIPESLGQLKGLKYLYLNDNELTGNIPESIFNINMVALYLSNNNFEGTLPSVISAKSLYINNANLSSLPEDIMNNNFSNFEAYSNNFEIFNTLKGDVPDNSTVSQSGKVFYCNEGYQINYNHPNFPPCMESYVTDNSHFDNSKAGWSCDDGYVKDITTRPFTCKLMN